MNSAQPTKTFHGIAGLILLGLGTLALPVTGCALVAGIEDRTNEEADPNKVVDEETQLDTRPQCVEYCNDVMDNCTGDNAVYAARESCVNTCNALPAGEPTEPIGNNVECRMKEAKSARQFPEDFCIAAGPGGEATCGSNCEAWCQLLEAECPGEFEVLDNCEQSCSSIPDDGGFDVVDSYASDDIQCRLIHLGAVGGDPDSTHCGHARLNPVDTCVSADAGEPSCSVYCASVMANCQGGDAVYDNVDDCMSACEEFPVGDAADTSENTLSCRQYHANAASLGAEVHCDHASPAGDGTCGTYNDDDEKTGNCESYCLLYRSGCNEEFAATFDDADACESACINDFAGNGAESGSFYTVDTATDSDGLQCRIYYSVKAIAGSPSECEKASPTAVCN